MITSEVIQEKDFQILKIPKTYRINDNKIYLKKVGNALYILPFHNPWQTLFDSLSGFTDDFTVQRIQPEQNRELFD